ncbi:hypothetical protein N7492_010040 [Penicillium capsulatum]|uniref:Uncharacterized protein n=1 Tax=Penicillium capsulatum TaxID=69766 RepID=A0A9W9LF17_9EURO|nr:hypothetical protein N7492_010040 [Penicillium capsulatum]KAJ6112549.1 hypothetical protein N7512_007873 [Penicillium capsulatum]
MPLSGFRRNYNVPALRETASLAIVNCKTRRQLSFADGTVITVSEASADELNNFWLLKNPAGADEEEQAPHAIVSAASDEAIVHSAGKPLQLRLDTTEERNLQGKIIYQHDHPEIIFIANIQSGTCLTDAEGGPQATSQSQPMPILRS